MTIYLLSLSRFLLDQRFTGFCIPRTQWAVTPADAVDCPPQTYLQQQNGQTVW